MKFLKKFESPNRLIVDGEVIFAFQSNDSYDTDVTFFYYNDKLITGDSSHWSEYSKVRGTNNIDVDEFRNMKNAGRLFGKQKIITFWTYPHNVENYKKTIRDLEKSENLKIWDNGWKVEVLFEDGKQITGQLWSNKRKDERLIPVEDYLQTDTKHVYYNKNLKQKTYSKNMTDAKYKNIITRHKFTENQQYYNKELNPKFWADDVFNERIRLKLVTIAEEFYNEFGYEVPIDDIILTGSLSNYNYNEYSDLDVHVLIDFKKINPSIELVKTALDGQRFMWNLRHNIVIKGHDVELYIQDINEPHIASGQYSLLNNKWLKKPEHNEPYIDKNLVEFKYLTYKSGIARLEEISQKDMDPQTAIKNHLYVSEYKAKIQKSRKDGLANDGEFSVQNLVFKKLRNSGDIEKLIKIIGRLYDKIYSQ